MLTMILLLAGNDLLGPSQETEFVSAEENELLGPMAESATELVSDDNDLLGPMVIEDTGGPGSTEATETGTVTLGDGNVVQPGRPLNSAYRPPEGRRPSPQRRRWFPRFRRK